MVQIQLMFHNKLATFAKIGLFTAALSLLFSLSACNNQPPGPESQTRLLLGTTITLTIYDTPPKGAFNRVFDRVQEIQDKMSTNEEEYDTTELLEVNRNAGIKPVRVSPDTFDVIRKGLYYSRLTNGAFDITIGPLVKLWGIGTDHEQLPEKAEIDKALGRLDYHKVKMNAAAHTIYLEERGMALDAGGIAKGYAADQAARILEELGVKHALLDFGGNILTVGQKPDGSDWRVGIQNPGESRGSFLGILTTGPATVVTSGNYERFFIKDGVRYHHILDSETGYPARTGLGSVTIYAAVSTDADALSTSCFVLGVKKGLALLEKLPDVEGAFVTKDDQVIMTPGMKNVFRITNDAFHEVAPEDYTPPAE